MTKKFFKAIFTVFVLTSALSCNRFDEKEVFKITPASLQMQVGETAVLTLEISPEPILAIGMGMSKPNLIEILNSSNKAVEIKAIGIGDVTFFMEHKSKKSECKITIKE